MRQEFKKGFLLRKLMLCPNKAIGGVMTREELDLLKEKWKTDSSPTMGDFGNLIHAYECLMHTHEANLEHFLNENTKTAIQIVELQDQLKMLKTKLNMIEGFAHSTEPL